MPAMSSTYNPENQEISYQPYTYLIGWSNLNKWYYGVRYAKEKNCLYESGCHPDDFWKTYFTSSSYVKGIRKEHGEPDIIQIRRVFETRKEAQEWEDKVLRRLGVIEASKWINGNVGGVFEPLSGENHPLYGKNLSEEHKKKIGDGNRGKNRSEETRRKISDALSGENHPNYGKNLSEETKKKMSDSKSGENHPMYGKNRSEETKKKLSDLNKGEKNPMYDKNHSEETKRKISDGLKDKPKSEETKKKMSDAKKGKPQPKITCPHCGKEGSISNMKRWHFDNCKHR